MKIVFYLLAIFCISFSAEALSEPNFCRVVRFSNPGWSDITATSALTSVILKKLGYTPKINFLSVPITYASLDNNDLDVYLGSWIPTMIPIFEPYTKKKSIEVLTTNLTGAKYGLAVPDYLYEQGLQNFKDIQRFSGMLKNKIYGIEAGNDGNLIVQSLIDKNEFGLKDFKLVESSEQAMLAQVDLDIEHHEPIVFLAWEPHPMNLKYNLKYLSGDIGYFVKDKKGITVETVTRKNYSKECPNVAHFLSQLKFTTDLENELMDRIINNNEDPEQAATKWLSTHLKSLEPWLFQIKTFNGKDALTTVLKTL